MTKKQHIKLLVLFLVISNFTIGQSTLNVAFGGKINIAPGTTVQSQNIDIGSGSQLHNWGDLTVEGTLMNNAGTSGLIIKSNANGTGSLLHNSTNVPASMEQYLTSQRWHLVSSPMNNATIETYLDIYLKQWNEADSSWTYLVQPVTLPLEVAKGYSAWASDDLTGTKTVTYEGNLNSGDYSVLLAYTSSSNAVGWNLIGNPYPSAIDWNLDNSWNRNNVGGWAVVYDDATFKGWNPYLSGNDRSYNGKTDGLIPATQGFWVKAIASDASLVIPQSQRTHSSQAFYKNSGESEYMSLKLKAEANGYKDETVIIFMKGATNEFDGLFDLEKLYNIDEAPNISSITSGKKYSVNVLPDDFISETDPPVIPVDFRLGVEQECEISASGIDSFDPFIPIYLEDLEDDVMINLREQSSYTFTSSPLNNSARFLVHFTETLDTKENAELLIKIYSHNSSVYINLPDGITGNAVVFDMLGKEVCSFSLHSNLTRKVLSQTGYFIVKITTDDKVSVKKVYIKS